MSVPPREAARHAPKNVTPKVRRAASGLALALFTAAVAACSAADAPRDLGALPTEAEDDTPRGADVPTGATLPSASDPSAADGAVGGKGVALRAEPRTSSAQVGELSPGSPIGIVCQTNGESIEGNPVWAFVKSVQSGYVAAKYLDSATVSQLAGVPKCGAPKADAGTKPPTTPPTTQPTTTPTVPPTTPPTPGYRLPLECRKTATVVQGPGGAFSHSSAQSRHAYDFGLANDTPLVAAEAGTVSFVRGDVLPGNPCYNGGGSACANTVNYVVIAHPDGTDTLYLHVNRPLVTVGRTVKRGDRIALSGGTGWSTGPHAHVQRQSRCGIWICNSVAMSFLEAGVPGTGASVTSANCP